MNNDKILNVWMANRKVGTLALTANHLDVLFQMGGSSGGARPKIFYKIDGEEWIIKFPSSADRKNIGEQEYDYSICAKKCGIEMSETRLLPSKRNNRDDHSKNFSFLYKDGKWQLSPAYDLTYSNSIGGEHATTINGNGSNPDMEDLLAVARQAKLDEKKARRIAEEVREIVGSDLKRWINKQQQSE